MGSSSVNSDFLAELTHDLRTPLNGILGFAALLQEERLGPLSTDQKDCLQDILTSANEMLQLINDVSDLGKLEAGTFELSAGPVSLAGLLDDVRQALSSLAAQKQVEICGVVDPTLDRIVGDRPRLRQILLNCVAHAVKATPAGGRVTIRATPEDARRFRLEIEDTGTRPKDLDADGSLGVAISRRIVEAHGGALGVRARHDRGDALVAVLPRTLEATGGR